MYLFTLRKLFILSREFTYKTQQQQDKWSEHGLYEG